MKKQFLAWAFALSILGTITSCSSSTSEQPAAETSAQTEATTDSTTVSQTGQMAYICPMECEGSASMKPGQCPVCGMDLVKNPAFKQQ